MPAMGGRVTVEGVLQARADRTDFDDWWTYTSASARSARIATPAPRTPPSAQLYAMSVDGAGRGGGAELSAAGALGATGHWAAAVPVRGVLHGGRGARVDNRIR